MNLLIGITIILFIAFLVGFPLWLNRVSKAKYAKFSGRLDKAVGLNPVSFLLPRRNRRIYIAEYSKN